MKINYITLPQDTTGLHYAVRILAGTGVLWLVLQNFGDTNPVWAVISMIIVTETHISATWLNFYTRVLHTLVGCLIGLVFLIILPEKTWLLPISVSATVLISNYIIRVPQGWRVAPITTAIVVSAGLHAPTHWESLFYAMHRTGEVLLGSAMALLITWLASLIWQEGENTQSPEQKAVD